MTMSDSLRVALSQLAIADGDKETNLRAIEDSLQQAFAQQADILVLPELSLTGLMAKDEMTSLAEESDGPSLQKIRSMLRDCPVNLVVSFPERGPGGEIYIATSLLTSTGAVAAHYRKTHLFQEENLIFTPGNDLVDARLRSLKLGLLTCYDLEFPEASRVLALRGSQLLVVNSANMTPYESVHRLLVQARAMENQCFVAYCNRVGANDAYHYPGQSCVADPTGEILLAMDEDAQGLQVVDLPLSRLQEARQAFDYLKERRSGLYDLDATV